ncbi:MAG: DNA-3-methyladenine glycosylase 2 family protein [Dehalococcoidia bacterium]|nr:DNA-3-methyladenine glycosylase 2 family protein [Dehalococcoidia bacterium]
MSALSAVRTTGIYCRDTCTGRPLARNVTVYRSAVAAEAAGYRPCLRCRPDRLPPFTEDDPASIVGRALSLIAEGALDHASEDALAGRLGVSSRHLRRLFHERVGATPALVATSRRAHFARRLLDETDLPITQIADAAGFATVRQLNRVVASVFAFTPTELRRKRREADRLVADGGLTLRLAYAGAFDFAALLRHRAPRAIPGVEVVAGGVYRRTISACGNPGVIEVSDAADGAHLLVIAHLPTLEALIDDVARCRRVFGLDRPAAAQTPLAEDRRLRPLLRAQPGLRVPGAWDPFETSVRVLLGQQVSVAAATSLAGRLVAALGVPVPGLADIGLTHLFPPAARIAGASLERLRGIGLPATRAEAIRSLARAYAGETLRLDAGGDPAELRQALAALPGVGRWTAEMIALFAAGASDAFPAGDLGLRRAAGRLRGRDAPASERETEELADAWRPHRALAAMHLWLA